MDVGNDGEDTHSSFASSLPRNRGINFQWHKRWSLIFSVKTAKTGRHSTLTLFTPQILIHSSSSFRVSLVGCFWDCFCFSKAKSQPKRWQLIGHSLLWAKNFFSSSTNPRATLLWRWKLKKFTHLSLVMKNTASIFFPLATVTLPSHRTSSAVEN